MTGAQAHLLPDGRLHLHHGPIDLMIGLDGTPRAVDAARQAAVARFDGLLAELVAELPALRSSDDRPLHGPIAKAMAQAVAPHRPAFITPMAAVAGAVADTVLSAMPKPGLSRAYVNNGGDIALYLTPDAQFSVAIAARLGAPDRITLRQGDGIGGIATSGWRGRSWSFGIADAVTVLAASAAIADASATMIANAVDVPGHPAITRQPANQLQHDTDLGASAVTTAVGPLTPDEVAQALDAGAAHAQGLIARGLVAGAALFLHPDTRTLGQRLALTPEPCHG